MVMPGGHKAAASLVSQYMPSTLAQGPGMLRPCRSFRPAFVGLHPLGGPRSRVPRRSPATAAATPYKPPSEEIASEGLPSEVRQRAETAILKRGGAVTVGDVAAVAGISLKEAEDALRALASDSLANLKVSDEGEILYSFDPNFRDRIRNKSLRIRLESTAAAVKDTASYLARVTFGTALLASVVTVALAITVIASSGNQSNDRDRRGNGGYYRGGPQFYFNITDLLWYWNPRYSRARQPSAAKGQGGMNFLEAIFSFVFGDPDPNIAFEAQRWEKIGQYIQSRGGVVAAEELAPMLEGQVGNTTSIAVDESYVLPVLTRFGGSPVVGQDGEILYHFPTLQQTAAVSWDRGGRCRVLGMIAALCSPDDGPPATRWLWDQAPCGPPAPIFLMFAGPEAAGGAARAGPGEARAAHAGQWRPEAGGHRSGRRQSGGRGGPRGHAGLAPGLLRAGPQRPGLDP
uniref:Iron-sulfur cluster biosynthesis family protein n=1 Tax=Auxenochlorella protothecoides TaxID=3075 RepID=A0A1D2A5K9_AUXPR